MSSPGSEETLSERFTRSSARVAQADQPPPIETMARFPDPADVAPHVVDLAWRLNALGERGDAPQLSGKRYSAS